MCPICYTDECDGEMCQKFADPGGNSALRSSSESNPRNQPCPTCGEPNRLTPEDVLLGYHCNECASRAEGTYFGADY